MADATPRRRGRPQANASLREHLLEAACALLETEGPAVFTFRQIALHAGVTSTLVHYYFIDRNGLLDAIARERAQPLIHALMATIGARPGTAVAALTCFVQKYTAMALRHRWLPLFTAQYVGREVNPCKPLVDLLLQLVERAQAAGELRQDLPASHVAMSLLSQCAFPFVAQATHTQAAGMDLSVTAAAQLTLHHLALLQSGIATSRRPRASTTTRAMTRCRSQR